MASTERQRLQPGVALGVGSRAPRAARPSGWPARLREHGSVVFIYALVLLVGGLAAVLSPNFREPANLINILRQTIVLGLVAIGQSMVILTGGIDMSIGTIAKVAALTVAVLFGGNDGLVIPLSLLGLAIGAGLGLLNGLLITRLNASPFIITFGLFSILRGIALAIASGPVGQIPASFLQIYDARLGTVPLNVLAMAILWALAWLMTTRTTFGRAIYAVGGSARVARLSAINVPRTLLGAYALSGLCGAAAGLFVLTRTGVGDPSLGDNLEFQSIVAVALGGISLYGGKGSLIGTLGGVLLLGVVSNVFNILQVSVFHQQLLLGLIVLVAVATYRAGRSA